MPEVARNGDTAGCGASMVSGAVKTYVNGRLVIRLGDGSSHGGVVTSASSTVYAEGKLVARRGDSHSCPLDGHGTTAITTGSDNTYIEE